MKCKKCNKEMLGYTADTYPFESGFKCPQCGREWSHLQISRAKYAIPENAEIVGGIYISDGMEFSFRKPLPEWEKEFEDTIVIGNVGYGDEPMLKILSNCGEEDEPDITKLLEKYFNAPTDREIINMKYKERDTYARKIKVKVKKSKIVIERIEE